MSEMSVNLIAPCGMNCRLCYGYIRPKGKCLGCNSPDDSKPKSCTSCKIVVCEKLIQNDWETCAPCDTPCRRLKDLDKRYRAKYHMSMMENLETIRNHGMEGFLRQQIEAFRCTVCGGILCVHRDDCPSCKAAAWEQQAEVGASLNCSNLIAQFRSRNLSAGHGMILLG